MPKSIAKLVDECAVQLQRIVRMKAAIHRGTPIIQCVSCPSQGHWKDMQGGHFIPRTSKTHKILEENIHPQCVSCNGFRSESAKVRYTLFMIDTYGREFVDELERTKLDPKKYYRADITETLSDLKTQARELEKVCPV